MQYTRKQKREKSLKEIQALEQTLKEKNYDASVVEKMLYEESVLADPATRYALAKAVVLSALLFESLKKKQEAGERLSGDELRGVGQMMNQTRKNLEALGLFEVVKKKSKSSKQNYFNESDVDDDDDISSDDGDDNDDNG